MSSAEPLIRVLAICQEDPELLIGGRGVHVRELYRAMAERGDVEIDLLTTGPGEGEKEYLGFNKIVSDKLVCWKPPAPGLSSVFVADIQMLRTVLQQLTGIHWYDLVHVHDWDAVQVGRAVRDAIQCPMIGTCHLSLSTMIHDSGFWRQPIPEETLFCLQQEGHLVVDSDRIITCSHAYAQELRQAFMTDRQIDVVYNGIPKEFGPSTADDPARAVETNDLYPDRPTALFVGRVADMKGIRPLIAAIEAEDTGYQVVIAGEVNADTEAQRNAWDVTQKLKALELQYPERLRWVGFKKDQDLKDLYSAATVGLMPSTHEPFGIVALEHMAMGNPLICSERHGLAEVVKDADGKEYALIIEPVAQQINAALKMLHDQGLRDKLRALGMKRASEFGWATAADETVQIYREAIG